MLADLKQELEQLALAGRERHFYETLQRKDGCVTVRGRSVVDFANWDLYDLNHHPVMRRAVQRTVEDVGFSAASSRAGTGTTRLHAACEQRIAEFAGFESAALFSSKNQAVFSLMTAIASERDAVLFDESMQSPVGDAAYLVNAPAAVFPSGNLSRLKTELEKVRGARRRIICVESLSPLTGEAIDIGAWSAAAQKADAWLVVDETHALGALGLRGVGGSEAVPVKSGIACVFADTAFALASSGAFIAGPNILVRYLTQRSRTFVAEVASPPPLVAGLESALTTLELAHQLRERMMLNAAKLREGLGALGALKAGGSSSHIVCVPLRSLAVAREVSEALFQKGIFAEPLLRPTSVHAGPADGGACVRFVVTSVHTPKQIETALQAFSEVWLKLSDK